MAVASDPTTASLEALAAIRVGHADLVESYAIAVSHVDHLLQLVTRIGGHTTAEEQRLVREARAFLKAAT